MPNQTRILLNAEPFGFGPAAAIASIAPLLTKAAAEISYIGEKHTLDLQRDLPYKDIYDVTDLDRQSRKQLLEKLSKSYSHFLTAMDFEMAEIAKEAGMKTMVYDALTWYWPTIHPTIKDADLYIAQNFFGVKERLTDSPDEFPLNVVVEPIISNHHPSNQKDCVLLNLGGLQNPFWEFEDTVSYARTMIDAVRQALPTTEDLIVATSYKVANEFNDPKVKTHDREDMIKLLERAKYAIMTPGLGNIYDAASFGIPALWLPPANDSQGQQTQLLAQNDCCDEYLDWREVTQDIDYRTSQVAALKAITAALKQVEQSTRLRLELPKKLSEKLEKLSTETESKTHKLVELFGDNGVEQLTELVMKFVKEKAYASTK